MSIKLAEKRGRNWKFARPFPAFNQVLPEQREKFILNLLVLTIFFCLTKYGRYGNLISARELAIANQSKFQNWRLCIWLHLSLQESCSSSRCWLCAASSRPVPPGAAAVAREAAAAAVGARPIRRTKPRTPNPESYYIVLDNPFFLFLLLKGQHPGHPAGVLFCLAALLHPASSGAVTQVRGQGGKH